MTTRGVRLNNPGNIRLGIAWQGMADVQNDKDFITFASAEYGIRAMAKVFMTYKNKYSIDTVRGAVKRYAPPEENNTVAYMQDIANQCQISEDDIIDLTDADTLKTIIPAFIHHENGCDPYTPEQISTGVDMAVG